MDTSDIIVLEHSTCSLSADPIIDGVPRSFEKDLVARFSFGVSNLSRRSFSQPILSSCLQKASYFTHFSKTLVYVVFILIYCSFFFDVGEAVQSTQAKALISPRKNKGSQAVKTVLDEFFGVYCLISRSPLSHYKNRCYIGYTVDPNRRIRQHNAGKEKGGAKKTDNRGPWDMVCIIHGFPNSVAALRFEWAWQNPLKSRVIKDFTLKKARKETPFAYRLRIACYLLNSRPWNQFALTFRWLLPAEELPFPEEILPPKHVVKKYGLIEKSNTEVPLEKQAYVEKGECRLCGEDIEKLTQLVRCPSCAVHFHSKCLAVDGLKGDRRLYPVQGNCPSCFHSYLWGDIVREQHMIIKVSDAQPDTSLKNLVPRLSKC